MVSENNLPGILTNRLNEPSCIHKNGIDKFIRCPCPAIIEFRHLAQHGTDGPSTEFHWHFVRMSTLDAILMTGCLVAFGGVFLMVPGAGSGKRG